jgi:hypothetical protein
VAEPEKDLEWNDTEFWDEEDAEVDEGDEERSASLIIPVQTRESTS